MPVQAGRVGGGAGLGRGERRELGGARPQGASAPGRVRSPQWSRWFVADRRQTPGYQPAQVRPGSGECRKELLDRHACLVAGEKPGQHLRLPRRSGRRLRAWNRGGDFHVGRRPRRDGDAAKLDESPFLQCLQTGPGHGFAVRHRLQQHAGARRPARGERRRIRAAPRAPRRAGRRLPRAPHRSPCARRTGRRRAGPAPPRAPRAAGR